MESDFVFQTLVQLSPGQHLSVATVTYVPTGETFFSMQMQGETKEQWRERAIAMVKDLLLKKAELYRSLL